PFCLWGDCLFFAPQEIFGYKSNGYRLALCIAGYLLSCGALLLLFYWKPEWDVWANCVACDLEEADVVLLRTTDEFKKYTKKKVTWINLSKLNILDSEKSDHVFIADKVSVINRAIRKPDLKVRYIQVQKIRYLWDISTKQFLKVGSLEDSNTCYNIHHKFGAGLTQEEQDIRRLVCGPNTIEVEIRPIWKLLFKEILNPFYVFQAFTLILWLVQGYIEYSTAIIILSIISIGLTIYDLRQQSIKLHDLVEEHNKVQLESRCLVPGDILVIEGEKLSLPCDAILIDGSCIVNEGMLTGESIPVTKTPLPHTENTLPWKTHSLEDYRKHVLFCGTEVIQTKPTGKGPVRVVVFQTGFNTAKGDLVRSILYPKPVNFKLYRDAFKFIVGLQPASATVSMALLLLTVAVPPAIPAALTIGIVYAQRRLKNKKIFCISPRRINICGQINLVCFDKTGTLTEEGLDLWGVIPSEGNCFQNVHSFTSGEPLPWGPVCGAMASCHSLVVLDGQIQGDPLDLKMFEGTGWVRGGSDYAQGRGAHLFITHPSCQVPIEGIAILRQFPFSSALQRMSVITQEIGKDRYDLYMKGAPEMVTSFCRPETVPPNFSKELKIYTTQGFRVIALAHRALTQREEVDSGLTFLGLLIMENRLKEETKPVLEELSAARIRSVMITGDNLQTAVTVARNSGMVTRGTKVILVEANDAENSGPACVTWQLLEDKQFLTVHGEKGDSFHFALNGSSYQVLVKHFSSLLPKILVNGTIFARMSPSQKSNLVEEFQKLNYYVGMCGDGANDCGALKMAHAGISLSEQEASVASPFTSQIPNIQCVPELIREGRAALVTSFAVFKYLTLYGLIQFVGTGLLFWVRVQNHSLIINDLCLSPAFIFLNILHTSSRTLTQAYPKLAAYRPPGQLISPPLLISVVLNVCFTTIILVCGFLFVKQQPWYSQIYSHRGCPSASRPLPLDSGNGTGKAEAVLSYENTTLWPLATINCIIVAFVFSKGKPFRKPIYTNYIFVILLVLQLAVCVFILFADLDGVTVVTSALHPAEQTVLKPSLFAQDGILQNRRLWLLIKACFGFQSNSQYRQWQRRLAVDPEWPPVSGKDFAEVSKNKVYINPIYEHNEGTQAEQLPASSFR
uniref:Cation-transporting ATPase n=1 Tax=Sphenodon punctatus TaxID=8508 RepID=A0A8D0HJV4_SPHPU